LSEEDNRAHSDPTLREIYGAVVRARDQPLSGCNTAGGKSPADGLSQLSLGRLCMDYSGPLLRQFVDGWVKNVTSPGGYGSIIGRRHIGSVEVGFYSWGASGMTKTKENLLAFFAVMLRPIWRLNQ